MERQCVYCVILAIAIILVPIIWYEEQIEGHYSNLTALHRTPREVLRTDEEIIKITVTKNATVSVEIDLCEIVTCSYKMMNFTVYGCIFKGGQSIPNTPGPMCLYGKYLLWNTDSKGPIAVTPSGLKIQSSISIIRGKAHTKGNRKDYHPLIITVTGLESYPNRKIDKNKDEFEIVIGVDRTGTPPSQTDLQGKLKIELVSPIADSVPLTNGMDPVGGRVTYLTNLTYADKLALETGFVERNEWLQWMMYTASQNGQKNCTACAKAKPQLGTIPFRLNNNNDPSGFQCALRLFTTKRKLAPNCTILSLLYPKTKTVRKPPRVIPYPGNYTCFSRSGSGAPLGTLPKTYCASEFNITTNNGNLSASWFINHKFKRADLWWLCGDMKLRRKLPSNWQGSCTLIQIVMPFYMFPTGDFSKLKEKLKEAYHQHERTTRSIGYGGSPRGSFDNRVYIDSIGVPRGVPDEFKARNQVPAGFESFLFWWSTINKNVDWINYIYYNQERFINYTRDAVQGIADQLDRTSLMAWQNRLELDMLLAEEGGICKMFGMFCCTFIPINTAPDGSITKALHGLTTLSEELAENSGIVDPFSSWMKQ